MAKIVDISQIPCDGRLESKLNSIGAKACKLAFDLASGQATENCFTNRAKAQSFYGCVRNHIVSERLFETFEVVRRKNSVYVIRK